MAIVLENTMLRKSLIADYLGYPYQSEERRVANFTYLGRLLAEALRRDLDVVIDPPVDDRVVIDGITFAISEEWSREGMYCFGVLRIVDECPDCHRQVWSPCVRSREQAGQMLLHWRAADHFCTSHPAPRAIWRDAVQEAAADTLLTHLEASR